jgi:hypothetical protein
MYPIIRLALVEYIVAVQAIYPGSNFAHYGEPANHARPLGLAIFS